MPWKETCAVEERMRFVMDRQSRELSMAALCRKYGVTRPVGYKWLERYQAEGVKGLQDRSRASKHHPNAVPLEIEKAILAVRRRHRYWGPRKILAWLKR